MGGPGVHLGTPDLQTNLTEPAIMSPKTKEMLTVRGLVVPSDWDEQDEVCAVTICADNEERYEVVDRKTVRALMKHMDEEIEAVGTKGEDDYGDEIFLVTSFEVITDYDDEDEDWDDEDDDLEEDDDDWDDR
jgi:hypothetical protein